MKLYMNPVSTTSRPVSLFAAEAGIPLDEIVIDLMTGEHKAPDFVAVNPNGLVPVLDDDGFVDVVVGATGGGSVGGGAYVFRGLGL